MLRPGGKSDRQKTFKKAIDADEARRKREDNILSIRKNKREENLQKKRREGLQAAQPEPSLNSMTSAADATGQAPKVQQRVCCPQRTATYTFRRDRRI